jgi:hypothetical protein
VEKEELAETILEILAKHAASNFHFPFTGDESWVSYVYHVGTLRTLYPANSEEVQRPSRARPKTIGTVFFNADGMHMINVLLRNQKMNAEYFAKIILLSLISVCYPNGRKSRGRKCVVYFDNTPTHN